MRPQAIASNVYVYDFGCLFITVIWQLNYRQCYLSVLKEKKGMQISEARTKIFIINGM